MIGGEQKERKGKERGEERKWEEKEKDMGEARSIGEKRGQDRRIKTEGTRQKEQR